MLDSIKAGKEKLKNVGDIVSLTDELNQLNSDIRDIIDERETANKELTGRHRIAKTSQLTNELEEVQKEKGRLIGDISQAKDNINFSTRDVMEEVQAKVWDNHEKKLSKLFNDFVNEFDKTTQEAVNMYNEAIDEYEAEIAPYMEVRANQANRNDMIRDSRENNIGQRTHIDNYIDHLRDRRSFRNKKFEVSI